MEQFIINGGKRLNGEVTIKAAKNSVLPIIACSILSKEDIIIQNVPDLLDIKNMLSIMKSIGCKVDFYGGNIYLNCKNASPSLVEPSLSSALRSSIFLLGPVLGRFKEANLGLPGGCAIGSRPIDIHIDGLKAIGANAVSGDGYVKCSAVKLTGKEVRLKFPSVGATENIIMAAVLAEGTTIIHNAAREPEVVDLSNFINALGGRVFGAGTSVVTVEGVKNCHGCIFKPSADRIAAPTYLVAAAATRGTATVKGISCCAMNSTLFALQKIGCKIDCGVDYVTLSLDSRPKAIKELMTAPHPAFPTDMQPQVGTLLALANGESTLIETIFENRFSYALQLEKMGARVSVEGSKLRINGVKQLQNAAVKAEDLRGGAALCIAGLAASGKSIITDIHHIDRGYECFEKDLRCLGTDIIREKL